MDSGRSGEPRTGVRGCVATDVFFATDEHGFSRIIAGGLLGFVLNHEWTRMDTNGHESARINVARAFQPEICLAEAVQPGNIAGCWSHTKPRREMHNFEVQQASRGRESAGVRMREAAGARVIVVPAAADPGVCFASCQQAGVRAFGGRFTTNLWCQSANSLHLIDSFAV